MLQRLFNTDRSQSSFSNKSEPSPYVQKKKYKKKEAVGWGFKTDRNEAHRNELEASLVRKGVKEEAELFCSVLTESTLTNIGQGCIPGVQAGLLVTMKIKQVLSEEEHPI